jgi:hypothetical protein
MHRFIRSISNFFGMCFGLKVPASRPYCASPNRSTTASSRSVRIPRTQSHRSGAIIPTTASKEISPQPPVSTRKLRPLMLGTTNTGRARRRTATPREEYRRSRMMSTASDGAFHRPATTTQFARPPAAAIKTRPLMGAIRNAQRQRRELRRDIASYRKHERLLPLGMVKSS